MKKQLDQLHSDISCVEEKINLIADEVMDILKQLSHDNQKQLNSRLIADKMSMRDTVKMMLEHHENDTHPLAESTSNILEDIAETIMKRFSEFAPLSVSEQLSALHDTFDDETLVEETTKWLDSSFKIVKKYFDSISARNRELVEFIRQTMQHLEETERHMSAELESQQKKFSEDREFEDSISDKMNMIKHDFNKGDIESIKAAVMSKIENINNGIEKKREQDMQRLKDTEKALSRLGSRICDIRTEADEIKKKAVELEFESVRDKLTGLFNRKAYDQKILESIGNLNRHNVSSSLMVCDIDYFKNVNDAFGHKVGDLVLKKLAKLLNEKMRSNDFIARYGGEEFVIILSHTQLKEAKKAGESLRAYIDKSIFSYKDQEIPVTISIGISAVRKDDDCFTVFERADTALYLAKKSGRNNVKTEGDVPGQ
jgi:diguanylate cyclase (GGDEF)-like protein